MFDWLIRNWAKEGVDRFMRNEFPKMLDRELPTIIDEHLAKRFAENPELQLTKVGMGAAMSLALRKHWPDIDRRTAIDWMWEYIEFSGIRFGDPDYEWTPRAAEELALSYVQEFGEGCVT